MPNIGFGFFKLPAEAGLLSLQDASKNGKTISIFSSSIIFYDGCLTVDNPYKKIVKAVIFYNLMGVMILFRPTATYSIENFSIILGNQVI